MERLTPKDIKYMQHTVTH